LIVLIAYAHPYWIWQTLSFSLALEGVPDRPDGNFLSQPNQSPKPCYLLQQGLSDAINVFDMNSLQARRCTASIMSLRPASRDKSDDARSGNINSINPVREGPKTLNNRSIMEQTSYLLQFLLNLRPARPSKGSS